MVNVDRKPTVLAAHLVLDRERLPRERVDRHRDHDASNRVGRRRITGGTLRR
jgi:hypothetical protein